MSADISDCIAMSEDGDWYAFPKALGRGKTMAAVARSGYNIGYYDWHETLKLFRVRAGHVRPDPEQEPGWWTVCEHYEEDAIPAWIVERK